MDKKWRRIKIGDLGRVVTGNTPPKKDKSNYGGPYPFIKPTDMTVGHRRCNEWEETYSEKAFQRYHRAYIPPGSTGVVTIGTVGEKLFQSNRWCFTNQSVNVVIPHQGQFDPDFVYYLMKVSLPKVENANPGTASGRHHVSKSNFESIGVDVPSYERQQKIGAFLSAYDELIENNLKRITLLEEKAQQTYEEWFVRMRFPGHGSTPIDADTGLPEGWEVRRHEEVCSLSGGGTPSRKNSAYWEEGVIDWYTPTDLTKANCIALKRSAEKTNELGLQKSSAKRLPKEAFMMTSRATIGYVGFVNSDFSTNQGFINVQPQTPSDKEYLAYNFMIRKDEFIGLGTGTTFLEISKGVFRKLNIVWPIAQVRESYSDVVAPLHSMIFQLLEANVKLEEARDILLPRLMTGMIDVEELGVELPMTP